MSKNTFLIRRYHSAVGTLLLGAVGGQLYICDWEASPRCAPGLRRMAASKDAVIKDITDEFSENVTDTTESARVIDEAIRQLDEYFDGKREEFDLPLGFSGTDFQRSVINALLTIPYGHTYTYSDIARAIGRPTAVRAAAAAIGSNQLSILVPCHRVVASDGGRGGYRGGLNAKEFLLRLEHRPERRLERTSRFSPVR